MKNLTKTIINCLSAVTILVGCSINSKAQRAEFGVRLMPTFTSFEMQTSDGGKVKGEVTLGYGFGAILGFNFTDHVGIQGEVIYNSISQKYTELDVEREVTLRYVNIPLLLSLNTGKLKPVNLNIVAGPQIGLNVGGDVKTTGGDGTVNSEATLSVKKSDLGVAFGAGLDFGLSSAGKTRLGIGYRGVLGLIDISDNSKTIPSDSYYILEKTHVKTNSAYIGISFLF